MGMRPIQFCLDLFPRFGGDEAKRIEGQRRSEQCLLKLLEALTDINLIWLQANLGASSIYEGVVKGRPTLRYRREVDNEVWSDVPTIFKCGYADCVPVSSLVLREDYTFVPMAELRPGDRIMGDGTWTEVTEHAITGEKELLAFGLSNGCVLRCTANHRAVLRARMPSSAISCSRSRSTAAAMSADRTSVATWEVASPITRPAVRSDQAAANDPSANDFPVPAGPTSTDRRAPEVSRPRTAAR